MTTDSSIETLTKLVDLTSPFTAAAKKNKHVNRAKTDEEKVGLLGNTAVTAITAASSILSAILQTPAAPVTEDSLRNELEKAETYAGITKRALSDRKAAKLVPAEDKTDKNANALEGAGYPKLAKLYSPRR